MGQLKSYMIIFALLASATLCFSHKTHSGFLYPQFYDHSCPRAQEIVNSVVAKAVFEEPRMAASLVRLLFHDCFVQGCDASLLLDNHGTIISEKLSKPNKNSVRGFEVLDEIKVRLEEACPLTVSCADIVALAARDSTVLAGGPYWEVPLGRRDSLRASLIGSNNNIPAPNLTFPQILGKFNAVGLDLIDLVALSGAHTIGNARCTSFKQRLYNQNKNRKPDLSLNQAYALELRTRCPPSGGDNNLFFLDISTPFKFDNSYYRNILAFNGLLNSDEVLLTQNHASMQLVKQYAENNELFFQHFANSMIKMGNISPLTGNQGEIRKVCRRVNHY
ncbi:peroxidase 72-like [Silene latifolia]|uniref:peroxidase 72-like n=1 Tax=Silene latifolia TaxID=37657 RepID=UPI003D786979